MVQDRTKVTMCDSLYCSQFFLMTVCVDVLCVIRCRRTTIQEKVSWSVNRMIPTLVISAQSGQPAVNEILDLLLASKRYISACIG